ARDVLAMQSIAKPTLLRHLFALAASFPAQILSYNKMLGQLQDAGNTVTLAHYVRLLSSAYLVSGLSQWRGHIAQVRASSPKFVVWNNALVNALSGLPYRDSRRRPDLWGRLIENAVGAHLLNAATPGMTVAYWREGDDEVDYVLQKGEHLVAVEVKGGSRISRRGLQAFQRKYPEAKTLVVGTAGVPLEKFFSVPPDTWL
ncbi:MAG: DUF4143 domain-containing protein, partial [Elusimicrobia bacterium]|nr:DUF4143 domain-containing protein [Elusimicrobiota bacterium]